MIRSGQYWHKSTSGSASNDSRSSRVPENYHGTEHTKEGLRAFDAESSASGYATVLDIFIATLHESKLPGPVILIDHTGDREMLGRGSQFVVYKQRMAIPVATHFMLHEVAVKAPKFSLNPKIPLKLASPAARHHLHNMYLEVLALTNPTIRDHPFVAKLLSWSHDSYTMDTSLYLVMELALTDLRSFLQDQYGDEVQASLRYELCRNIAAGIDVLHECGLIHGDLKSENILVFKDQSGDYVAKVADFGLSIAETVSDTRLSADIGGTRGWQAPEVEHGRSIPRQLWVATDNYSFGLLVWSVLALRGHTPPANQGRQRSIIAMEQIQSLKMQLGNDVWTCLVELLSTLLQEDPSKRPKGLQPLFCRDVTRDKRHMGLDPASSDMTGVPVRSPVTPHHDESYYDWETSNVAHIFIEDVYTRMLEFPESTTSDILFSIFLVVTAWPRITDESSSPGSDQVQVLLAAAGRGSVQARGVLDTVSRYYGSTLGRDIDVKLPEWRRTAVLSGSLLARRELALHDREAYIECTKRFREEGGYAMLYASVDSNERINIRSSDQGYSRLHWLVTCGTPAALQTYLESERDIDIDRLTAREETAVYLACARGSLEMLQILLANGADCRMTCTQWRISCLHWAFAFDEDTQAQVISCIVAAGANLDTMTSGDTPFPHYPFILPRGTPLHWAVATGSHVMIEALILHRANVLARNGHDIYVYDRRVRALNEFGGANLDDMEAYSVPNGNVEGLTALDYAAMALDYFIFEDLIRLGLPCDVNDVDEEGLSVLHRLSTSPRRRTRTGNQFCDTVFRGARSERHEALVRSIKAITELGGNLELLTTRSSTIFDYTGIEATFPQYTPLMMAALGTSEELVDVLLSAGAEVNAVNDKGGTALLCVSEDVEAASKIIPILISHGAEINHADHHGSTAVAIAAGYCMTDTVELLLSKGADIESKSSAEDAAFQGCSIFGMLASADKPFNDAEDQSLRRMLEDYVFASPDRAKRRRVVDQGDSNGHTLLHHYSRNGLPHCVKALLSNSAPVNAIERRYRTERDGSMDVRLTWYETPLDAAQITRDRKVKDMQRGSIHTLEQNEDILSKLNAVIDALQAAGGVCRRNFVQRETCEDV